MSTQLQLSIFIFLTATLSVATAQYPDFIVLANYLNHTKYCLPALSSTNGQANFTSCMVQNLPKLGPIANNVTSLGIEIIGLMQQAAQQQVVAINNTLGGKVTTNITDCVYQEVQVSALNIRQLSPPNSVPTQDENLQKCLGTLQITPKVKRGFRIAIAKLRGNMRKSIIQFFNANVDLITS